MMTNVHSEILIWPAFSRYQDFPKMWKACERWAFPASQACNIRLGISARRSEPRPDVRHHSRTLEISAGRSTSRRDVRNLGLRFEILAEHSENLDNRKLQYGAPETGFPNVPLKQNSPSGYEYSYSGVKNIKKYSNAIQNFHQYLIRMYQNSVFFLSCFLHVFSYIYFHIFVFLLIRVHSVDLLGGRGGCASME